MSDILLLPLILSGKDERKKGNGFINNAWLRNNKVLHLLHVEFFFCKHRLVVLFVPLIVVRQVNKTFVSVRFSWGTIKLGEYSWTFLLDSIFDATLFIRYQEIMIFLLAITVSMRKEGKMTPLFSRPVPGTLWLG